MKKNDVRTEVVKARDIKGRYDKRKTFRMQVNKTVHTEDTNLIFFPTKNCLRRRLVWM